MSFILNMIPLISVILLSIILLPVTTYLIIRFGSAAWFQSKLSYDKHRKIQ